VNKDAVSTAVIALAMAAVLIWAMACPGFAFDQSDLERLLITRSCPGCDLSGADLSKADLTKADLWGADLRFANLAEANLLEADLRARLVQMGIELETRRFKPHVTIAYVRRQATPGDRAGLAAAIEEARSPDRPSFTVSQLILVRSDTGPGGSVYSHLHAVRLG